MLSKTYRVEVPLYGLRTEAHVNKIGVGRDVMPDGQMSSTLTEPVQTRFSIMAMIERHAAGIPFGLMDPSDSIDIIERMEAVLSHYENKANGVSANPMAGAADTSFNVEFAVDLDDLCQEFNEKFAVRIRRHKLENHKMEKAMKLDPIHNTGIKYGGQSIGFSKETSVKLAEQKELEDLLQERTRRLINENFK